MLVTLLINQYETTGMLRLFALFPHISLKSNIYLSPKLQLYMPLYIVPGNILKIEKISELCTILFSIVNIATEGDDPLVLLVATYFILRPTDKKAKMELINKKE